MQFGAIHYRDPFNIFNKFMLRILFGLQMIKIFGVSKTFGSMFRDQQRTSDMDFSPPMLKL